MTVFADPALLARIRFQAMCVALIAAHLLIDFCKERLTAAAKIRDNAITFLADQAAHIVTIVAAALLVTGTSPVAAVAWLAALVPQRDENSCGAGDLFCGGVRGRLRDPLSHAAADAPSAAAWR